jgi:hypothetical protein
MIQTFIKHLNIYWYALCVLKPIRNMIYEKHQTLPPHGGRVLLTQKILYDMGYSYQTEIELLIHQIELEESNYKYAVELKKDYNTLRRMRENIRELKEALHEKLKQSNIPVENLPERLRQNNFVAAIGGYRA